MTEVVVNGLIFTDVPPPEPDGFPWLTWLWIASILYCSAGSAYLVMRIMWSDLKIVTRSAQSANGLSSVIPLMGSQGYPIPAIWVLLFAFVGSLVGVPFMLWSMFAAKIGDD